MMAADVHVRLSIAAFSLISLAVLVGSEGSLFTSDDPLVILNTENFYKLVPRSQNAWFIDFYSSWCGHCIRFAPTWKELGSDISGWNGVLQVAAVDCAQEENLALCRDFSIEAYPTLKFINAFSDKSDRGLTFDGGRKTEELKHAVIDFLQNITDEGHRPPHLPHLHALRYMEDMWGDVTSSIRHTAVVFEESGSYLGRELLLDFSSRTDLMIRRMTKEHVAKFGVREFPSLFLIEREGTFKKIAQHKDRKGFQEALNAVLGVKADKDRSDDQANALRLGSTKPSSGHRGAVHLADLESGLHYSLRQEVASHKDISGQKLEALKAYLSVLAKYFPGSEQTVNYLKLVAAWIEQQKGPLTGATWLKNINQKQERLQMSSNAENSWRQARSNMMLINKARARSQWLHELNSQGIISPWSSGEEPLPLYAKVDERLLHQVAGFRMESCLHIQAAVAQSLEAKAVELEKDTGIILSSLEQLLENNSKCSFDQAKEKLAILVGKETASLKQQLSKKKQFFLDKRQHDKNDFAHAKFVFAENVNKTQNPNPTPSTSEQSDPPNNGDVPNDSERENKSPRNTATKSKGGRNATRKDFRNPRTNENNNVPAQNGGWKTISRKRERSKSNERTGRNPTRKTGKPNTLNNQRQGWTLSAREKELIKAFRRN